jgi:hypothetical protein
MVKVDARGRERALLAGLARTLASPARRPLHLLIELNKQAAALAAGLPSALAAAKEAGAGPVDGDEALSAGADVPAFALSDEDNARVAEGYAALMKELITLGYEVLVADRGWWAAQEPFRSTEAALLDGTTIKSWSENLSRRGEVDLWAYIPQGDWKIKQ